MSDLDTHLDRAYAVAPDTRAAALAYLRRTGNEDLAEMLGLVDDPIAARQRRVKALVEMGSRPRSQRAAGEDDCPRCSNRMPRSGVCRKTKACRETAARNEVEAS